MNQYLFALQGTNDEFYTDVCRNDSAPKPFSIVIKVLVHPPKEAGITKFCELHFQLVLPIFDGIGF
jgi:hypothetical protein